MAKKEPLEATPEEREESMDLDIQELISDYEAQIGHLTGQLIQKNLAIKKLKAELLKKQKVGHDTQDG